MPLMIASVIHGKLSKSDFIIISLRCASGTREAKGGKEKICRTTEVMEQTSRGHGM